MKKYILKIFMLVLVLLDLGSNFIFYSEYKTVKVDDLTKKLKLNNSFFDDGFSIEIFYDDEPIDTPVVPNYNIPNIDNYDNDYNINDNTDIDDIDDDNIDDDSDIEDTTNDDDNTSDDSNNKYSAEEFLSILNRMSKQVEKDYKNGKPWKYEWIKGTRGKYQATFDIARDSKRKATCVCIASWALIEMGILEPGDILNKKIGSQKVYFFNQYRKYTKSEVAERAKKNLKFINGNFKTASYLEKKGKLKAGDIVAWSYDHVSVYAGDGKWYDTGRGNPKNKDGGYTFTTWGPVKMSMSNKIYKIIRIK